MSSFLPLPNCFKCWCGFIAGHYRSLGHNVEEMLVEALDAANFKGPVIIQVRRYPTCSWRSLPPNVHNLHVMIFHSLLKKNRCA